MGDPNFLAAVVDDSVLVRVTIGGGSTRRGGEELGKVLDLVSKGTWDNKGGWDGAQSMLPNLYTKLQQCWGKKMDLSSAICNNYITVK